jgi:hypothetical protein
MTLPLVVVVVAAAAVVVVLCNKNKFKNLKLK